MKHCTSTGLLTEVNEGNEELAGSSLPSVTSRAVERVYCVALCLRTPEISNKSLAVFATTHWSVVLGAGGGKSPQADAALEKLCRTYWDPMGLMVVNVRLFRAFPGVLIARTDRRL